MLCHPLLKFDVFQRLRCRDTVGEKRDVPSERAVAPPFGRSRCQDSFHLRERSDDDTGAHTESRSQGAFDMACQVAFWLAPGPKHSVAGLQVRQHVPETLCYETIGQRRHRDRILTADIHSA